MTDDLRTRSQDIHWPDGFSPDEADLFSHNEIDIQAPPAVVWGHIVAAEKWPSWYPNSHDVRILNNDAEVLGPGTQFEWDTFGTHVLSDVSEFVEESRIGWYGDATGLHAYHTWLLKDTSAGCQVIMEEAGNGPEAVAIAQAGPGSMHDGHELWLTRLRDLSESTISAVKPKNKPVVNRDIL